MAVEIQANTPLAESLQNAVQNRLMELGWTSGGLDDTSLAEYIVLMLVSGKTEEEVSSDLKNDILGDLNTEGTGAPEFAAWLFQQLEVLSGNSAGQQDVATDAQNTQIPFKQEIDGNQDDAGADAQGMAMDEDMNEPQPDGSLPPTGPKSMRNGKQRDKRMLGHMNRALDRSGDQVMHRIKGAANAGRINSHSNRDPPKGPAPKGPRATMQRIANGPPQRQAQQMQQMNPNNPNNPLGQMTPQQQVQLFAMYEQQAKMMAQIFNPSGQAQPPQQNKSLFDRVDTRTSRNSKFNHSHANGTNAAGNDQLVADANSSMEVENGSQGQKIDASTTMCRFNLTCSKADCHFVHQSPAAPPGTAIDMNDTCTFGAGCKNRKCTARHPSPANLSPMDRALSSGAPHAPFGSGNNYMSRGPLGSSQADSRPDCRFYPHCTNPACPFKHPSMPPCRNGADCTVANCHFYHNTTACKFDPCLNPSCPYKHAEGQKRGSYKDKVWVNGQSDEMDEKEHLSERKFVDEGMEEELVRGDGAADEQDSSVKMEAGQPEGIIT